MPISSYDGYTARSNWIRANQPAVVTNVSALRALDKTKISYAVTKGYYTAGDGGAGEYWYDSSDTTSTDNGGTVIKANDNGRWKIVVNGTINIECFGVVGNGIVDDTAAFKSALASGASLTATAGKTVILKDSVTFDIGKISAFGNGAILDFSSLAGTTKAAITFVNTNAGFYVDLIAALATKNVFSGFAILGPGKSGGGVSDGTIGLQNKTSHCCVRDCIFYGFGTGLLLGSNSYAQDYDHVAVAQCALGILLEAGGSNYGERIIFTNSSIYDNVLAVSNNCNTGALQFIGCSIDYNIKSINATNNSVTELISTWLECDDAGSGNVQVSLSGASNLIVSNGKIVQRGSMGALSQAGFINTSSDSSASFNSVFMFNTKNSNNVFDSGSGSCELRNTKSYTVSYLPSVVSTSSNKMIDGSFESSSIKDLFSITSDTATITNRLTGTNISLSLSATECHTGTKSLQVQKGFPSSEGMFSLVVYANPGDRCAMNFWYKKPAATDSNGNVYVTFAGAKINGILPNGVPEIASSQVFNTIVIGGTSDLIDWTNLSTGMDRRIPSWGNAVVISFNMNPFKGSFYFDDFNISVM